MEKKEMKVIDYILTIRSGTTHLLKPCNWISFNGSFVKTSLN